MGQVVKSIKGVHDVLPDVVHVWHFLEDAVRQVMASYGYSEIRTPILEKTELFSRSIGDVTDIVEKEMYSFEDRNGDLLSLRPENTASCVRAAIQHGLLSNQQMHRLWYLGPQFRRENPQRGRYRQFWQVGAEVYGIAGPYIEAELILLSARLWQKLGLTEHASLQINSLGNSEDRDRYRDKLVEYLKDHHSALDDDSKRRLTTNPLRVLDSKNPDMAEVISAAPSLLDHLCEESQQHFSLLQSTLRQCGVPFEINTRLVRGLDYYSHTVFEWVTDQLGAQGTICAGGRYDGLTEQLGASPTPGVGWALGIERLLALINDAGNAPQMPAPHIYLVLAGDHAIVSGMALAEEIRLAQPAWRTVTNCAGASMKSQFKRADKSGAHVALVIGEGEIANNTVSVKLLREQTQQQTVSRAELMGVLQGILG